MKLKTLKKSLKFLSEDKKRPVEVRRIGRVKTMTRYYDTTNFDKMLYEDKIDHNQHQIAEWLYAIGIASGIRLSTSSSFEPTVSSSFSNLNETERSTNCRMVLSKCLNAVKSNVSNEACSLLEAIVLYDKSVREWAKCTGYGRNGKIDLFKKSLDEVQDFRDNQL